MTDLKIEYWKKLLEDEEQQDEDKNDDYILEMKYVIKYRDFFSNYT